MKKQNIGAKKKNIQKHVQHFVHKCGHKLKLLTLKKMQKSTVRPLKQLYLSFLSVSVKFLVSQNRYVFVCKVLFLVQVIFPSQEAFLHQNIALLYLFYVFSKDAAMQPDPN